MPKAHEPNDILRAKVRAWAEWLPTEIIRKRLGIGSRTTLYKHYSQELESGRLDRDLEVVRALHLNAIEGNVSAQIFWCKARLGMHDSPVASTTEDETEVQPLEVTFEVQPAKSDIKVTKGK